MFEPCAIVPVYRHEHSVRNVVRNLAPKNLPVILVDDGNAPAAKEILQKIAQEFPNCFLISNEKNLGKGGAFCAGLRFAAEKNFSHAFQIDADGQHDLSQMDFFLKEALANPEFCVCGFPEYDSSVPLGRKIGRKVTDFWIAVETCSLKIRDAMCGFRIYPIQKTLKILPQIRSFRMGFDVEILVRLSWAHVGIFFYPVKVFYPEDGVSNFRMFADNLELSKLHTRLCVERLLQIPYKLLGRHHD